MKYYVYPCKTWLDSSSEDDDCSNVHDVYFSKSIAAKHQPNLMSFETTIIYDYDPSDYPIEILDALPADAVTLAETYNT